MEPGFIALIAVMSIVIGVLVGFLFGKKATERQHIRDTRHTQGTLTIDCCDSEFEPGMFLGLGVPVKDVMTRKYVTLDVNVLQKKSHE